MKELKLSPKERELLEPFYESAVYQKALKPYLQRLGQSLAGNALKNAKDMEEINFLRGQGFFIQRLNKLLRELNEESREKEAKTPAPGK